jgi:Protein phosphatase 2C
MSAFNQSDITIQLSGNKDYVTRSLCKGQDQGFMGDFVDEATGETCEWMVGCDGHGTDHVINFLRKGVDWTTIMKSPEAYKGVVAAIDASGMQTRLTGATYAEAKMWPRRVETCTIGDSEVFVYVNGNLVFKSTPHNMDNPAEVTRFDARIKSRSIWMKKDFNIPIIVSPDTLDSIDKPVFVYENGDRLNMTQALGHENITGYAPEFNVVHFEPEDEVVVIIGSDGLTEMVTPEEYPTLHQYSVHELADLAQTRWMQEWTWRGWDKKNPSRETKTQFQEYDDILAMKWTKPVPSAKL